MQRGRVLAENSEIMSAALFLAASAKISAPSALKSTPGRVE